METPNQKNKGLKRKSSSDETSKKSRHFNPEELDTSDKLTDERMDFSEIDELDPEERIEDIEPPEEMKLVDQEAEIDISEMINELTLKSPSDPALGESIVQKEIFDESDPVSIHENLSKEYEESSLRNFLLNKFLYEYHFKKQGFVFTDLPSDVPVYQEKYNFTLEKFSKLGFLMEELEAQFKEDNKEVLENRKAKEEKLEEFKNELKNILNEAKSLVPPKSRAKINWTNTEKLIETLLKSYELQFEENLKFIKTDRNLHEIVEENERLNTLNLEEGFKIENYDELREKNDEISAKVENKNFQFEKLRSQWNEDIQTLAHCKEKEHLLQGKIDDLNQNFEKLGENEHNLKRGLYRLLKEKQRLRVEFMGLNQSAGLLNHRNILRLYDQVSEEVEDLKKKIELDVGTKE